MRAVVQDRYGPPEVLRIEAVERPALAPDGVLVAVHATTVNRTDCGFRQGKPFIVRFVNGLRRPRRRILGTELAGVVEAVGEEVTEFAVGDEVFGVNDDKFGAHAELVCVRESAPLALKPPSMTFEEAAAVGDGLILGRTCLRWAGVREGTRLVVYGASGSIGTAAVQVAKHLRAHVTAVCNTANVDLVRTLGPDEVIDYTQEDFTENGETYDVVLDAVGKHSFRRCRDSLVKGGVFTSTDLGYFWQNVLLALVTKVLPTRRVMVPIPKYKKADLLFLKELIAAGEYQPVIDRCYPFEDVVEATRYVETEQKTGNVVLTIVKG